MQAFCCRPAVWAINLPEWNPASPLDARTLTTTNNRTNFLPDFCSSIYHQLKDYQLPPCQISGPKHEIGWKCGTSSTDVCSSFRRFKDPNQSEELGVAPVMPSKTTKSFPAVRKNQNFQICLRSGGNTNKSPIVQKIRCRLVGRMNRNNGSFIDFTLLQANISLPKDTQGIYLKMWRCFFLFPRWDMLVPPRYLTPKIARHSNHNPQPIPVGPGCCWVGTTAD